MLRACVSLKVLVSLLALLGGMSGCSDNDSGNDASQPVCGNGQQEAPEACDATDFGTTTCWSLGYWAGELGCTNTCELDVSQCEGSLDCSNGTLDPGENCDDGNRTDWDGCTRCEPSEFRITLALTAIEPLPSVAAADDGRFSVAWLSHVDFDAQDLLTGRRFQPNGLALAAPVEMDHFQNLFPGGLAAAGLADGAFAAVWTMDATEGAAVFGRVVGESGELLSDQLLLSALAANTESEAPQVIRWPGDGFLVAWLRRHNSTETDCEIRIRRFDASGPVDATPLTLVPQDGQVRLEPRLVGLSDGFALVWVEQEQGDPSRFELVGQRFDPNASPQGAPFVLAAAAPVGPGYAGHALAATPADELLAVWDRCGPFWSDCQTVGQWLTADGSALGTEMELGEAAYNGVYSRCVAAMDDGTALVAWSRQDVNEGGYDLRGRFVEPVTGPLGPAFTINVQTEGSHRYASVTALGSHFLVVWRHSDVVPRGIHVYGTLLDTSGNRLGIGF